MNEIDPPGRIDCIPLSCTTILVTRTAVSVVICIGPSRRPLKPFPRNSDVRSIEIFSRDPFETSSPRTLTSGRIVTFTSKD